MRIAYNIYEFSITMEELIRATEFAKQYGDTDCKTITMCVDGSSGIGNEIKIGANGVEKDITNIDCW